MTRGDTPARSLTATDGSILGIGDRAQGPALIGLDADTGSEQWRFARGLDAEATAVAAGPLVAVAQNDSLVAVDPQPGEAADARWQVALRRPWPESMTGARAAIIVANRAGSVCRYDPQDGATVWCATVDRVANDAPQLFLGAGTVVIATGGEVAVLDFTLGELRWSFGNGSLQAPVAVNEASVFTADQQGTLYALDRGSGIEQWREEGVGELASLAADDGGVYTATLGGIVAALP